jgi:hypothetical protein
VQHFLLGDLRLVEIARLGDGGLLRVAQRACFDAESASFFASRSIASSREDFRGLSSFSLG